jgi:hypothetical protein
LQKQPKKQCKTGLLPGNNHILATPANGNDDLRYIAMKRTCEGSEASLFDFAFASCMLRSPDAARALPRAPDEI